MSLIKLLRTKYGSIPIERDNEGYFTCFFSGCCQKIAGDWTEHLKAHELAGDTIDYSIFVTQPTDYLSTSTCTRHLKRTLKQQKQYYDTITESNNNSNNNNIHKQNIFLKPNQQQQTHSGFNINNNNIFSSSSSVIPRNVLSTDYSKYLFNSEKATFDNLLYGTTNISNNNSSSSSTTNPAITAAAAAVAASTASVVPKSAQDIPSFMRLSEGLMRKNVRSFYQYNSDVMFGDLKQGPNRVYQRVTEFQAHSYSPLGPSWPNYPPPPYTLSQHAATSTGECSLPQDCYPAQSFLGTVTPTGDLAPPPVYAVAEQDVSTLTDPTSPFFINIRNILIKLENFITDNSQEFSGPEKFQFELAAIDKSLGEGKYKFVKDVANNLSNIWEPLIEANGQHNIVIIDAIKEIRLQIDDLCTKEREKVDERIKEDENSCNFTPNDTCAICRKGGDLFFCSGACHRCYHVECLGNLEGAFSTNHICPQCFHGKPVLHYDTKKNGFCYFSYRRRGLSRKEKRMGKFEEAEKKAVDVLLKDSDRKIEMRKGCEESRINTMYYDPIWCTWRSKSERITKDRYNAVVNAVNEPPKDDNSSTISSEVGGNDNNIVNNEVCESNIIVGDNSVVSSETVVNGIVGNETDANNTVSDDANNNVISVNDNINGDVININDENNISTINEEQVDLPPQKIQKTD